MTPIELPHCAPGTPLPKLFAVQGADGRWLVYLDEEGDRIAMLLFTSEATATRYVNASPDLLDSPGYSLVPFGRDPRQLLQLARCARARGVQSFQVDPRPWGECRLQIDLERLLADG
jgi:hypothetical protein